MSETQHDVAPSARYELEELFPDEAPENLHFLKVMGLVVVVALLGLAAFFVLTHLS